MKVNMPARISIINLNQNSPKIYDGFVSQISPNIISNIDEPLIDKFVTMKCGHKFFVHTIALT